MPHRHPYCHRIDLLKDTEAGFKIEYVKKENGGLHTGYNKAIELAQTELMVCVDSDDYMPGQAVEKILDFWKENGSDQYAGRHADRSVLHSSRGILYSCLCILSEAAIGMYR